MFTRVKVAFFWIGSLVLLSGPTDLDTRDMPTERRLPGSRRSRSRKQAQQNERGTPNTFLRFSRDMVNPPLDPPMAPEAGVDPSGRRILLPISAEVARLGDTSCSYG